MKEFSDDAVRIAKGLCAANGYSTWSFKVGEGMTLPLWVAYLSEAEQMVRELSALKHKP